MGVAFRYLLDLPVYRLTEAAYIKQRTAWVKDNLFSGLPSNSIVHEFYAAEPRRREWMENHLERIYGGGWHYNEIVGYIRLHILGSQIRGEYYGTTGKRIVRSRKKQFEFKTWKLATEAEIPEHATSADILRVIRKYVVACEKEKELRGRYVDKSVLENLGSYVDWERLYKDS